LADYELNPLAVRVESFDDRLRAGVLASFIVDASLSAVADLVVQMPPGHQPATIVEIAPRRYKVTFLPLIPNTAFNLHVLYGGQPIFNRYISLIFDVCVFVFFFSPFLVTVIPTVEPSAVRLWDSEGNKFTHVYASLSNVFLIDSSHAGRSPHLAVEITVPSLFRLFPCLQGPDGQPRPLKISMVPKFDDRHAVEWTPDTVGLYLINVLYDDRPISLIPLKINALPVGDATKALIIGKFVFMPSGYGVL
jgi:hypothetical protein